MRGRAAGLIAAPSGVVLHGSRSGVASRGTHQEFEGTASWAVNNPDGLCWHATIGDDEIALHLDVTEWGWHARWASDNYLAVEFAQSVAARAISDAQVDVFCWWHTAKVEPRWGKLRHFPTHAEIERQGETGVMDGKTDVFEFGSPRADELRSRILARL